MESVLQQEEWKDIKGYEGFYQVSNLGRVKSIAVRRFLGKYQKHVIIERERMMALCDTYNGYVVVYLASDRKRKRAYVHRLVAEAFCDKKEGQYEINHIDFNRSNNRADNLEWCNHTENMRASRERLMGEKKIPRKSNTGERYITYRKKFNRYEVNVTGFNRKRFMTLQEAIAYRDIKREEYREKTKECVNR